MCFLEHRSPCRHAPIYLSISKFAFLQIGGALYFVIERAVYTILFCTKDISLNRKQLTRLYGNE